ncbi:exopolysaccharide biosynthesis protein [Paracoccus nototheniae]|uniref:Exopolysaccharide biosynthesis protein n=1 Tax=Paracoccus nototheniae TaxID=2489002 RepID=A0ABW4E2Q2_9RHOB|nr:exopolysaccharide biosynthesis protein [Paracoccus nototheniae]
MTSQHSTFFAKSTAHRFPRFSGAVGLRVVALLCILLCTAVPPLELLPFASSIPMGAIALMGLGLMVRDGLVILIAALGALLGLGVLHDHCERRLTLPCSSPNGRKASSMRPCRFAHGQAKDFLPSKQPT